MSSCTTRIAGLGTAAVVAAISWCCVESGKVNHAGATQKRITAGEARSLAYGALVGEGNSRKVTLEEYQEERSPEFYGFEALRSNPGGNANAGFYLVNSINGDVWSIWGCKRVENRVLKRKQEEIRDRLKLSRNEALAAQQMKPFCQGNEAK